MNYVDQIFRSCVSSFCCHACSERQKQHTVQAQSTDTLYLYDTDDLEQAFSPADPQPARLHNHKSDIIRIYSRKERKEDLSILPMKNGTVGQESSCLSIGYDSACLVGQVYHLGKRYRKRNMVRDRAALEICVAR